jgi:hypothetical protein
MDELLIKDQKYISSKRASELTGYAKDYIGQLCREGRVEARLVGRSWYVREAGIKDHRFGNEEQAPNLPEVINTDEKLGWTSARYEAEDKPQLPDFSDESIAVEPDTANTSEKMQSAWQDWFSKSASRIFKDEGTVADLEVPTENPYEIKPDFQENDINSEILEEIDQDQDVPIIKIDSESRREQVFHDDIQEFETNERIEPVKIIKNSPVSSNLALRAILVLIPVVTIGITAIGVGFIPIGSNLPGASVLMSLKGESLLNK